MKKPLAITFFLLIVQSLIAQDGYPKQILWDGDTVVVYTPKQHRLINYQKDSYDNCIDDNESLNRELVQKKEIIDKSREAEAEATLMKEQAREIDAEQTKQNELCEKDKKVLSRKLRFNNTMKYAFGGAGLTIGTYVGNKLSAFILF